jgi:hypothetical protein
MLIEGFSEAIFFKAILRIFPSFILLKTPEEIRLTFYQKGFLTILLSIILYGRLINENVEPSFFQFDFLYGSVVGLILSFFFSASMRFSYFFEKAFQVSSENSWKSLLDTFGFIVIILFLAHLRIEKSLLNLLVSVNIEGSFTNKFLSIQFWSKFLTDVSLLALKVSGFGLIFVLSKKSFDEIYLRIGGEGMRVIFSLSFFSVLLILTPFLIPSFVNFFSSILSSFWKAWIGG